MHAQVALKNALKTAVETETGGTLFDVEVVAVQKDGDEDGLPAVLWEGRPENMGVPPPTRKSGNL